MIGSLEVTHELIFTIPSVVQISSISSIRLRFNLWKPRISVARTLHESQWRIPFREIDSKKTFIGKQFIINTTLAFLKLITI